MIRKTQKKPESRETQEIQTQYREPILSKMLYGFLFYTYGFFSNLGRKNDI